MEEKKVEKCFCDEGYEAGAIKKNFEFENFSIFGNIMKKNTIVIRYNGYLKYNSTVNLYYVIDNNWKDVRFVKMQSCDHDKNSYCAVIHLDDALNIAIGFCKEQDISEVSPANSYQFKVTENPIDNIMKRHNLEVNEALPTIQGNKNIHIILSILSRIKQIFASTFACKKQALPK